MGIWNNSDFIKYNPLPQSHQLTLDEGNTPLSLVELPGHTILAIKDETKNPTGSFKDRSLAYQMSIYLDQRKSDFVISSSGNAAISAAAFAQLANVNLDVFLSERVNQAKLEKLQQLAKGYTGITIHQTKQPKSDAIRFAAEHKVQNLRGSQDPLAVIGFKTLAYEIAAEYPEVDAVFVPCSSGTSALALTLAFSELNKKVAVIICQTTKIHPIAGEYSNDFIQTDTSLADAISDRVALRKIDLLKMINTCGGSGVVISDAELTAAKTTMVTYGFDFSYNSLLGFAGFFKVLGSGKIYLHPVVIASGL